MVLTAHVVVPDAGADLTQGSPLSARQTRDQYASDLRSLRALVEEDGDSRRALVDQIVQEVLESEMDACLQARKGERTP